jgi:hypothetical protein
LSLGAGGTFVNTFMPQKIYNYDDGYKIIDLIPIQYQRRRFFSALGIEIQNIFPTPVCTTMIPAMSTIMQDFTTRTMVVNIINPA